MRAQSVAPSQNRRIVAGLPFVLTGDQQRSLDEIRNDLAGPAPMR